MRAVAEINPDAGVVSRTLDLLAAWMPRQRWYTAKGAAPSLRRVGGFRLADSAGAQGAVDAVRAERAVDVETLIVADEHASPPVVYQVPLTSRDAPLEGASDALVGAFERPGGGTRYVYDAPHDPAYVAALLQLIAGGGRSEPAHRTDGCDAPAAGHPQGGPAPIHVTGSRVLTGEQSNTSIIVERAGGPLIAKVFRVLAHGENPDVVLTAALDAAGCDLVPAPFGALSGQWDDPESNAVCAGHLAVVAEFLPGTLDAWRVACDAAAQGRDFTDRARELGAATARVHAALAEVFPTGALDAAARAAQVRSWRDRRDAALDAAGQVRDLTPRIDAILAAAADAPWPPAQRVHGDYHLGQVLDVPGRGWVLLDFEGEPLRPLAERTAPDLPLRDVAGMLRSFDYVAGSVAVRQPDRADAARAWAAAAREAFLDGYASARPDPRADADAAALLAALELDKALYEIVYETRNRPDWVGIPVAALTRLCTPHESRTR